VKKIFSMVLLILVSAIALGGCSNSDGFDTNSTINLVSREEGSGTRGAFVEILGILEKDEGGNEIDRTYEEAIIQNSTEAVISTVSGDKYSIGYISLGSLKDKVKALKIDGVEASTENIQNGSYKISRPFNVAYKGEPSPLAKDFLNFILSEQGQTIVAEEGYVQVATDLPSYNKNKQEGKLVIAGSTSVTPVMEKLAEAYEEMYPDVSIEIQATGSSAGMQAAMEGTADIGMASRELKDSELAELTAQVIAIDGIAIIVNNENPIGDLTIDEVKSIYTGEITHWNMAQ